MRNRWKGAFPLDVPTPDNRRIVSVSLPGGGSWEGKSPVFDEPTGGGDWRRVDVVGSVHTHRVDVVDGVAWFVCEFSLHDPDRDLADDIWFVSPNLTDIDVEYPDPEGWGVEGVRISGDFMGFHLVRERCWDIQTPIERDDRRA